MNTQPLFNSYLSTKTVSSPAIHSIIIPNGNHQVVIQTDQLMCMEGCGNYTFLYTNDGKRYLVSKTLKSYAAILDDQVFLRVHKSWIINLKYLQEFCEYERSLKLRGGREIAISRRRIREVCEVLTPIVKCA
ncbi:LytR/AlgR family response regulator transcription factor [Runella aurantiaca]|jgi:two-component system LytT family response regulator|uniref:LytTR family transcriptional regulator n=1 Tax=Runella aurantiaca TaxID=2282308 RepID=A0A369IF41_9BACT|nr:LytTR family DNA-binding domain-containing protein [Runella aurantiaca]RDB05246.1 LytTR family transcriptional regulator [Runella aurantiaca]